MEIRTGLLTFPRARGSGPRSANAVVNFPRSVRQAVAGLAGTSFGFSANDDHHLGLTNLRLRTQIDDDVVLVEGTLGVRDWSGNWDDDYEGTLGFVVLAELELVQRPSNLSITGLEWNQAIQYFRSQLGSQARPDNAIGLIAQKDTVARVYVDTQSDPSRPMVSSVSGRLEILARGASSWTSIAPLNPGIAPIRDGQIRRTNAGHTLNFLVPGALGAGEVQYRVRVYDAGHPDQPGFTSPTSSGTVTFREVAPLRARGVGIHYTRDGADIAPATLADLRSTLTFIEQTYPVGDVQITGMDTIDYDGDFTATGSGCGPGWGGLLDRLRDMQSDTGDVYYGLLTSAIPTGGVIGCGGGGGRVAAGFVGDGSTAGQEVGHAFGRRHAPCGNPGNVDSSYPNYAPLPMASIGEVGIDPLGNVHDPNSVVDFMSYCGPTWISAYTYEGLQMSFPPIGPSPRLERGHHEGPHGNEQLFLALTVYRTGVVELKPSFHYPSRRVTQNGEVTSYAVELRDRHNRPMVAERLLLGISEVQLDDAALDLYAPVPFPPDTARVVITCGKKGDCSHRELLSVDVPVEPPRVWFVDEPKGECSGKRTVRWAAANPAEKTLHYIVRYSADRGDSWRVIQPRTTKSELVVDFDRLPGGQYCLLQVLATEGIRTGSATSQPFSVPKRPREVVIASPGGGTHVHTGESTFLTAEVFSPSFGSAPPHAITWTSDVQGQVGAGRRLDTRVLKPGRHVIRVAAPDGCDGTCSATTVVNVAEPHGHKHTTRTHGHHSEKDHKAGKLRDTAHERGKDEEHRNGD